MNKKTRHKTINISNQPAHSSLVKNELKILLSSDVPTITKLKNAHYVNLRKNKSRFATISTGKVAFLANTVEKLDFATQQLPFYVKGNLFKFSLHIHYLPKPYLFLYIYGTKLIIINKISTLSCTMYLNYSRIL